MWITPALPKVAWCEIAISIFRLRVKSIASGPDVNLIEIVGFALINLASTKLFLAGIFLGLLAGLLL